MFGDAYLAKAIAVGASAVVGLGLAVGVVVHDSDQPAGRRCPSEIPPSANSCSSTVSLARPAV